MYVDILRINKGGNKLMSVRQLKENKRTKDGRSWVFIQYSKGLDDKRHQCAQCNTCSTRNNNRYPHNKYCYIRKIANKIHYRSWYCTRWCNY